MTLVNEAEKRYEAGEYGKDQEQGILFKLLQKDKRYAIVMAMDMIFAGIDTVNKIPVKFVSK